MLYIKLDGGGSSEGGINGSGGNTGGTSGTVTGGISATNDAYTLLDWNDLGMHCVDGKDDPVFSIPPYPDDYAAIS